MIPGGKRDAAEAGKLVVLCVFALRTYQRGAFDEGACESLSRGHAKLPTYGH